MLHVGIVGCTACTSLINLNLRLHEDFVSPLEVILMALDIRIISLPHVVVYLYSILFLLLFPTTAYSYEHNAPDCNHTGNLITV